MDVCIEWGQTLGLKVTVKGFVPQINVAKAAEHKRTFIQYSVPTNDKCRRHLGLREQPRNNLEPKTKTKKTAHLHKITMNFSS